MSSSKLLGANVPSQWLKDTRTLSGVVFETTSTGEKVPLA
jgi:hypothetical protein